MSTPKISICIPAYKRTLYLERLLESTAAQNYKDFEVIVTDDTPGDEVKDLCERYRNKLPLSYFKNPMQLGTPENWNESIRHAKGEWIKLMHDDDWFASPESLGSFAAVANNDHPFIFSGYYAVSENSRRKLHKLSEFKNAIIEEPGVLFAKNVIGPPSVTLIHKNIPEKYDKRLKWRVDIEFYMRVLKRIKHYKYIDAPLINCGLHESQVTQSAINNPEVELPEAWLLLKDYGVMALRNIKVYDAWWRLLRNMNIRDKNQLLSYVNKKWPGEILRMLDDERKIPSSLLKTGVMSKLFMALSYFKNKSKIK
jgi:glycosyltransferase involved in cell wall biosynthesis